MPAFGRPPLEGCDNSGRGTARPALPAVAIGWTSAVDLLFTLRPAGRLGVAGREQGQLVENRPMPIPAPAE